MVRDCSAAGPSSGLPVLDSGPDMARLAALERFLERLFERPGARIFRPAIRPIQIQRRIERTMEHARRSEAGRVYVPTGYVVRLHPTDLPPDPAAAGALASELADAALRFARDHRYAVRVRPTVELLGDERIRRGEAEVAAADDMTADVTPGAQTSSPPQGSPDAMLSPSTSSAAGPAEHTARYAVPSARIPATVLRAVGPDGRERRYEVSTPVVTIGRARDNQVVLDDRRASRYHARVAARAGGLVFIDLESTNGSIVNGRRVRELALGAGDRIEVGRTSIFVESVGPPAEGT